MCEPYFTGSHQAWAQGLARHSRHRIELVTHGGGFWKWRMQGAALTLADQIEASVADHGRPDVLVVSDMVHLPALLGLARRSLAGVPVVLYLHENQLTYPPNEQAAPDLTYAMTNWLSMAAADRIVFNSEFHRRDLLAALPTFLDRLPDHRHRRFLAAVVDRTEVLPIGIDVERFDCAARSGASPRSDGAGQSDGAARPDRSGPARPVVLWNHRWEHDKDPDAFFAALAEVSARGVDFELTVAGPRFATAPDAFDRARRQLATHIGHYGPASADDYPALLARADVVVSTARHEFFGVAVAEAIAAGALPLLPDRLAYPELVPSSRPYLYRDRAELIDRLCWALTEPDPRRVAAATARHHIGRFAWPTVAPRYDRLLDEMAAAADSHGSNRPS